jgi:hypothetical protein
LCRFAIVAIRARELLGNEIGARPVTQSDELTGTEVRRACERTVRSAVWEPPIDRAGVRVATEITYTCRFEIRG